MVAEITHWKKTRLIIEQEPSQLGKALVNYAIKLIFNLFASIIIQKFYTLLSISKLMLP